MPKSGLNEFIASHAIMRERYRRSVCVPRYTPSQWWECDVFEVMPSGLWREYEIKLTPGDFRADKNKSIVVRDYVRGQGFVERETRKKHDLLSRACPSGPSQFWYVLPAELAALKSELPKFAGLILLHDRGDGYRDHWRYTPDVAVQAPKLHGLKIDPKITDHARGVCYYRMHDLIFKSLK